MTNKTITSVELHISPYTELPRSLRRKIRAAGGEYRECRGYSCDCRFVTIPATEEDLINHVVEREVAHLKEASVPIRRTVMIARGPNAGRHNASWVIVHTFKHDCGETPTDFLSRRVTECQASYDERYATCS